MIRRYVGRRAMENNDNNNDTGIVPDVLAKSLKSVRGCAIDIDMEGQSALSIEVDKGMEKISINFIHSKVLSPRRDEKQKQNWFI